MNTNKRIILFILLIFLASLTSATALAQTTGQYFPETDRWVEEPFLSYYLNTANAEYIFGYPITDAYQTSWTTVQYFQNLRLEIDDAGKVIVSPLGDLFYEAAEGKTVNNSWPSSQHCQIEMDWEYPVCFEFLDFYIAHGGEEVFGKPISGLKYYDEVLVQNFYNARLEWQPFLKDGESVSLTNLGSMFLNVIGENQSNSITFDAPTLDASDDLNVWAIVSEAVTAKNDTQILWVSVSDQNSDPLESVNVFVNVIYANNPDNPQQTLPAITDSNGIAKIEFEVIEGAIGKVQLVIVANYKDQTKTTRSSFIIWH